jgi:hypothetical protein
MATGTIGERVRGLLRRGDLTVPLPGGGATERRFAALADLGADDLDVARLAEAHTDALAILAELDGDHGDSADDAGPAGLLWGVWAADPPVLVLEARRDEARPDEARPDEARRDPGAAAGTGGGAGWLLSGAKPWCSGATLCDRALVTAHADDGYRLFAIDPRHPGVRVRPSAWAGVGMTGSDTRDLDLVEVPARAVGGPGDYLDRPGFWWGAAGVAAVWLGGARRIADALVSAAARHDTDLVSASLGRVDAAQHAAWCTLLEVARLADGSPVAAEQAQLAAARARAAVEGAVEVTLHETGRATGPGPLVADAGHAKHVADLQVYVRQSHGDRDLAALGRLVAEQALTEPDPAEREWPPPGLQRAGSDQVRTGAP